MVELFGRLFPGLVAQGALHPVPVFGSVKITPEGIVTRLQIRPVREGRRRRLPCQRVICQIQ